MNKSELIYEVGKATKLPAADIERTINAATDIIKAELAQGGKVQLIGFGTFEVRDRAERSGRNPRTGEVITLPASKLPVFKAGKSLKEAVNGGNAHDR